MNKTLILSFVLFNYSISQIHQDSIASKPDFEFMYGLNVIASNYTFGIEEGANKGKTDGFSLSFKIFSQNVRIISLELGSINIVQKSPRLCEGIGNAGNNFRETVSYLTADFTILKKEYYFLDAGVTINDSKEESTICYNEIFFASPLLHFNLGAGLIDYFSINFGINTDYAINNSHGNNYGFYVTGINYSISKKDFFTFNYFWKRDDFNNSYSSGWFTKNHFNFYQNLGINSIVYYLIKIKCVSVNFGLTYLL